MEPPESNIRRHPPVVQEVGADARPGGGRWPAGDGAVAPQAAACGRGAQPRASVLEAAADVFAESGTDGSLEEIARRAGVGIGTLYRHFPTRGALVEQVYRDGVDALCASAPGAARAARRPEQAIEEWVLSFAELRRPQARHRCGPARRARRRGVRDGLRRRAGAAVRRGAPAVRRGARRRARSETTSTRSTCCAPSVGVCWSARTAQDPEATLPDAADRAGRPALRRASLTRHPWPSRRHDGPRRCDGRAASG